MESKAGFRKIPSLAADSAFFRPPPPHTMGKNGGGRQMRLGVALEGGGVRCAAQAGVLLGLFQAGIKPFAYAGCGAGALVAALAATGTLREDVALGFAKGGHRWGRLRLASLDSRLQSHFGGHSMREMAPVALPTIDMETGSLQILSSALPVRPDPRPWSRQALIATAVRAAMATPGALPPVSWRARRLIGGGQLRPVLPELLLALGAERLLTIRVLDTGCAQLETHPAALAICAHALTAQKPPTTDMMIVIGGYEKGSGALDRKSAGAFFEAGRLAGQQALPQIQRMIGHEKGKIIAFPLDRAGRSPI